MEDCLKRIEACSETHAGYFKDVYERMDEMEEHVDIMKRRISKLNEIYDRLAKLEAFFARFEGRSPNYSIFFNDHVLLKKRVTELEARNECQHTENTEARIGQIEARLKCSESEWGQTCQKNKLIMDEEVLTQNRLTELEARPECQCDKANTLDECGCCAQCGISMLAARIEKLEEAKEASNEFQCNDKSEERHAHHHSTIKFLIDELEARDENFAELKKDVSDLEKAFQNHLSKDAQRHEAIYERLSRLPQLLQLEKPSDMDFPPIKIGDPKDNVIDNLKKKTADLDMQLKEARMLKSVDTFNEARDLEFQLCASQISSGQAERPQSKSGLR
jgi:DNA repair exonuclease SbcCD ATPase subunit